MKDHITVAITSLIKYSRSQMTASGVTRAAPLLALFASRRSARKRGAYST
jgi:hypothetical protein